MNDDANAPFGMQPYSMDATPAAVGGVHGGASAEAHEMADSGRNNLLTDATLLTVIQRQQQEVDTLKTYMARMSPEAQLVIGQDLQTAENALAANQEVPAGVISRIAQTVSHEGGKELQQATGQFAEAVAGTALLKGSIAEQVEMAKAGGLGDLLGKFNMTDIPDGSQFTPLVNSGIGNLGAKQEDKGQSIAFTA